MDGAIVAQPSPLIAELANGLHAMAQPLTILRGAMCALTMHDQVEPANRRYLDMSTKQVDRLCDLMSGMQNLLHAAQGKNEFVTFDLVELLEPIFEQYQGAACESGVQVVMTKPDHALHAFGNEHGVEQAFNAALRTAISIARPEDRIEIEVASQDGFACLTLRNESFRAKNLGSFERFQLTVIETIVRNQCGAYKFAEMPFCISIHLQISEQPAAHVTSDCLPMAV